MAVPGSGSTTVRAPALIADHCESEVTQHNFSTPYSPSEMKIYREGSNANSRTMFEISLKSDIGATETLDFYTYVSGDDVAKTCAGPINASHCYLRSAIAEYEVVVKNGAITLVDPANPTFISWANNTAINNATINKFGLQGSSGSPWISTTLSGLVGAFTYIYEFTVYGDPPQPNQPSLELNVPNPPLFLYQLATNYEQFHNNEACALNWKDPRPLVMAGLNELMFSHWRLCG